MSSEEILLSVFQFCAGREFVNEERAKNLIESATSRAKSNSLTQLRIGNKSYDNAAAQAIANYLDSLDSNIDVADIGDIIAGRPEEEALRTLTIICSGLKRFNLTEFNVSDNAMGAKGVEACKEILCGKSLKKLYMCNDGLSAEALVLLASILLEGGCPPLDTLHFYNNMSGSGGAAAVRDIVRHCPDLESFRYSATRPGPEGCLAIAEAIASVTKLKRIDVADDNFGEAASLLVAEALKHQPQLEYLNLRDDAFSEEGFVCLFDAIKDSTFPNLNFLDLSGNEMSAELVLQFSQCFVQLNKLEQLLLDDNEFGTEGCLHMATALSGLVSLNTLSVCCCEISGKGAFVLSRALSKLPKFLKLEINGNALVERAIDEVKRFLLSVGKIIGDLEDNDEDGEDDIESVLAELEEEEHNDKDDGEDELVAAMKASAI